MKTTPNYILKRLLLVFCASLLVQVGAIKSNAADGSWNVDADGNWSTAANWLNNIIATDPASTAYFTNALTAVHTVTLDSVRTNGNLVFDNANATTVSAGWILSGSGLTLTNGATTPIITVSNMNALLVGLDSTNDVIVSSVITSPQGFIKKGPGTLTLTGANVLGSSARLDEGIVAVGNASALGSGNRPVDFNGGGIRFWAGAPAYANTNNVLTTASVVSSNGNYDALSSVWTGSGTIFIHATGRLSPGNGNNSTITNFTGTIDLTDCPANEIRFNLGSGGGAFPYDFSKVTLNLGTNAGRVDFRTTVAPATVRIGALMGSGVNTRLDSSEQGAGTSLFWEIGYLNTSTTFDGQIRNRNGLPDRVGHLVKVGTGRLTLTGTNIYTGNTIISNGVLALTGSGVLSSTPSITVFSPGRFDVSGLLTPFSLNSDTKVLAGNGVVTGAVAMTTGTVSPGFGVGNIATLQFTNDLSVDGTTGLTTNVFEIGAGVSDQILVGGNLTLAGTVVVRLVPTGPSIPNGTYNIYKWGGTLTGDTSNFILSYAPQPGTIVVGTNLVTKTIFVQVSGAASSDLTWRGDGAANDWDVTATANWRTTGGTATVFNNGDNTMFNDSGSNNVPVNIVGTVNPGNVLFTNITKNYEVGSTSGGKISGSAVITKKGAGTVILSSDNDNNGLTTIAGGVLQIGNGGSSGTLGSGTVSNGATLVFNRDTAANNGLITGPGNVIQTGSGALTLSGVNTYNGNTVVSNGTLNIGGAGAIGSGTLALAGGTASAGGIAIANAINVVDNSAFNSSAGETQLTSDSITGTAGKTLTLSGGTIRFTGAGFTLNSDVILGLTALQSYNQFGNQTFNGVISGTGNYRRRWPSSDLSNTGTTIMNGANTYSGGTLLREGSIGFGISSVETTPPTVDSGPIGTGTMTQDAGTSYTAVFASGGARSVGNPIVLNLTGAPFTIKGSFDLNLSGTIDLGSGNKEFAVVNTAKTVLTGDISNGNLIKSGAGSLFINGNNNASLTTVTGGTLGGTGTFVGPVVLDTGTVLAPGASIGTLTINSDLSVGGSLAIEVNKSLVQSNDYVVVTGVLTNAGTGSVTVNNLGPALAVGNKFTLFSQPLLNGNTMTITGGGATWVNNLAVDGSISVASLVSSQPPLITSVVISGGNIVISGTNGTAGGSFSVLSSTNVATPRTSWPLESSGTFGAGGSFSVSLPVSSAIPAKFYLLKLP